MPSGRVGPGPDSVYRSNDEFKQVNPFVFEALYCLICWFLVVKLRLMKLCCIFIDVVKWCDIALFLTLNLNGALSLNYQGVPICWFRFIIYPLIIHCNHLFIYTFKLYWLLI